MSGCSRYSASLIHIPKVISRRDLIWLLHLHFGRPRDTAWWGRTQRIEAVWTLHSYTRLPHTVSDMGDCGQQTSNNKTAYELYNKSIIKNKMVVILDMNCDRTEVSLLWRSRLPGLAACGDQSLNTCGIHDSWFQLDAQSSVKMKILAGHVVKDLTGNPLDVWCLRDY